MSTNIMYLGTGTRQDITSVYPWLDQGEDDSGEPPIYTMIGIIPHPLVGLDLTLLMRVAGLVPRGTDMTSITLDIKREVAHVTNKPSDGQQHWFVLITHEAEQLALSSTIH